MNPPDSLLDFVTANWPTSTAEIEQHLRSLKALGHLPATLPQTPRELKEHLAVLSRAGSIQGDDSGWGPPKPRVKAKAEMLF